MVTVTVCVGSSCHLKGSRNVIVRFNELLAKHGLKDKVALKGSFCMDRCGEGINWRIDDEPVTSACAEDAIDAFQKRILEPLGIHPANESGDDALP